MTGIADAIVPPPTPHRPPHRQVRAIRRWLLIGVALVFLAVYKGPGGYVDQFETMEMGEQLWLHGSLYAPDQPTAPARPRQYFSARANTANPPAAPTAQTHAHRYPIGLMLLSAPLVWLGALLQTLTGGFIDERTVLCLLIPLCALLTVHLVFDFAVNECASSGGRPAVALASALVVGLGTPLLTFQRLFYTEVPVLLFLVCALVAHQRERRAPTERRWPLLTGAALAAAVLCHYADLPLAAGIGLAMLCTPPAFTPAPQVTVPPVAITLFRLRRFGWLCVAPIAAALLLCTLNAARFGGPLTFGYTRYVSTEKVSLIYFGTNLKHLAFELSRVLWLCPAVAMAATGLRWSVTPRAAWFGRLLAVAFLSQLLFWGAFQFYGMYPLRYGLPLIAAGIPGLVLLLTLFDRRWPRFGLSISTGFLLLWSTAFFLYFDCNFNPPVIQAGDCAMRPFYTDPYDGTLRFFTWYTQPNPHAGLMFAGSVPGAVQWLILTVLLATGLGALLRAARLARPPQATP